MLRISFAAWLAATPVAADPAGFYLKAFGGISGVQDTDITMGATTETGIGFDSGTLAGGSLGYGYGPSPWAAEFEFAYRSSESSTGATSRGDFASTSLMVNGVYSFEAAGRLTPYVGAGLGYVTEIDFDVPGMGEFSDRGGLAWQAFGGVSYRVSDMLSAFAELRYFDAGSRTLSGGSGTLAADYSTLDVAAGLSFSF